jgi:hypothetical protein
MSPREAAARWVERFRTAALSVDFDLSPLPAPGADREGCHAAAFMDK